MTDALPVTASLPVRGLLARSILQAQTASPIFTHVYAAVVAIINSKFPQIGELILKRLILTFRRSYRRNLKVPICLSPLICDPQTVIVKCYCHT